MVLIHLPGADNFHLSLTLAPSYNYRSMYTSTFSDWFSQAVIDYVLGHRTISVFSEFLHKLQSTDPGELIRLSKIRAEAIATAVDRVLSEGERLLGGWTMFAPEGLNAKISEKFEEKVLLLVSRRKICVFSFECSCDLDRSSNVYCCKFLTTETIHYLNHSS